MELPALEAMAHPRATLARVASVTWCGDVLLSRTRIGGKWEKGGDLLCRLTLKVAIF